MWKDSKNQRQITPAPTIHVTAVAATRMGKGEGTAVPSRTYVFRIRSGATSATGKMSLVR